MNINKKTFCSAPWFQVRQQMNGTFTSCCHIQHKDSEFNGKKNFSSLTSWLKSDYLEYIKQNLNAGNKISECRSCWNKEASGITSLRAMVNQTVAGNRPVEQSWLHFYFKNKQDYAHDTLISADIKTTNICNYACAMCVPADSSRIHAIWKKSSDHPLVQEVIEQNASYLDDIDLIYRDGKSYRVLEEILQNKPKHLKMLGGESLLDSTLIKMLEQYEYKNSTSLSFVTNGSVDLTAITNRLSGYKNVSFILSVEGVGGIQNYIRRGSNWNTLEQNVNKYIQTYGTNNLYIHYTLQSLTVKHFPELLNWADSKKLPVSVAVLHAPEYFSLSSMPPELFDKICNKLAKINTALETVDNNEVLTTITLPGLIELVKTNYCYNEQLTKKLKTFLEWYDPAQEWKKLLPEWNNYF